MNILRLEEHFDKDDFAYSSILKAWATITGNYSIGRYLFITELLHSPFASSGNYMAFLRRPNKKDWKYEDVPFEASIGFLDSGEAEIAVFNRVRDLGWRINEINPETLPVEVDNNTRGLLERELVSKSIESC